MSFWNRLGITVSLAKNWKEPLWSDTTSTGHDVKYFFGLVYTDKPSEGSSITFVFLPLRISLLILKEQSE